MDLGRVGLSIWMLLVAVNSGRAQTCSGNGFDDGCTDVYALTGEPTGYREIMGSGTDTEICEGNRIAVVHDCVNRIPLYVAVMLDRQGMDTTNPGRCSSCTFQPSSHLDEAFQAIQDDYTSANDRTPCYERESNGALYRDRFWNSNAGVDQICTSGEPHTGTSRGHMIADNYIRIQGDKAATYHFTNCVPQYQKFNSESWNIAEQDMMPWAQQYCGTSISDSTVRNNARLTLIVGNVPSTSVTETFDDTTVEPRWFGEWGFGDGVFTATTTHSAGTPSHNGDYRVNMPASMWTAACCVGTDSNSNVAWVRHTAFGRHAKPIGTTERVIEASVADLMAQMLPEFDTSGVNLFPGEPLCNDPANYIPVGN